MTDEKNVDGQADDEQLGSTGETGGMVVFELDVDIEELEARITPEGGDVVFVDPLRSSGRR